MLVFPQLVTGASTLYPLKKRHIARTVANLLGDGRRIVYEDSSAATVEWDLNFKGLTRAEADAIEALFEAVSGQWGTFTFLDPAGNLLARSEEFDSTEWTNGPLIQLTTGLADPLGTTRATHAVNAGQAGQMVAQRLDVPGDFRYSLSVWARAQAASTVSLRAETTGASTTSQFALNSTWKRISLPISLGQATTSVTFGVSLTAGAAVDLFAMQVEPQVGASDYKRTGGSSGVYSQARFDSDSISITAQATDIYDTVVRIVAAEK